MTIYAKIDGRCYPADDHMASIIKTYGEMTRAARRSNRRMICVLGTSCFGVGALVAASYFGLISSWSILSPLGCYFGPGTCMGIDVAEWGLRTEQLAAACRQWRDALQIQPVDEQEIQESAIIEIEELSQASSSRIRPSENVPFLPQI